MMEVTLDGPADAFCDNNSVVINSTVLELMLTKKNEGMSTILADCLTKNLPGPILLEIIQKVLSNGSWMFMMRLERR